MKLRNMSVRSGRNLRELPLVAYSFEKLVWNIYGVSVKIRLLVVFTLTPNIMRMFISESHDSLHLFFMTLDAEESFFDYPGKE